MLTRPFSSPWRSARDKIRYKDMDGLDGAKDESTKVRPANFVVLFSFFSVLDREETPSLRRNKP